MEEYKDKSRLQYFLIIIFGIMLLLLSEFILVHFHLVHMFAIVPTLFITSGIIGFVLKKTKWKWYQNELDNGVLIGLGIILGYGFISVPFNFQRTEDEAIIYILFSITMVIAGIFLYPIVFRMFLKRNRKFNKGKNSK